jgi:hypothetical protein
VPPSLDLPFRRREDLRYLPPAGKAYRAARRCGSGARVPSATSGGVHTQVRGLERNGFGKQGDVVFVIFVLTAQYAGGKRQKVLGDHQARATVPFRSSDRGEAITPPASTLDGRECENILPITRISGSASNWILARVRLPFVKTQKTDEWKRPGKQQVGATVAHRTPDPLALPADASVMMRLSPTQNALS